MLKVSQFLSFLLSFYFIHKLIVSRSNTLHSIPLLAKTAFCIIYQHASYWDTICFPETMKRHIWPGGNSTIFLERDPPIKNPSIFLDGWNWIGSEENENLVRFFCHSFILDVSSYYNKKNVLKNQGNFWFPLRVRIFPMQIFPLPHKTCHSLHFLPSLSRFWIGLKKHHSFWLGHHFSCPDQMTTTFFREGFTLLYCPYSAPTKFFLFLDPLL